MAKKVIFLDDSKSILKTISYTVADLVNEGLITMQYYDDSRVFASDMREGLVDFDILFSDIKSVIITVPSENLRVSLYTVFEK